MRPILALSLSLFASAGAFAQTATTEVLWYHGNGGEIHGGTFNTAIQGFGGTVDATTVWPDTTVAPLIDDYRLVVLGRPSSAFDQQQVTDLQTYIDSGGVLVIAGESNSAGLNHITNTNALIGPGDATVPGLDLGMQLVDTIVAAPDNNNDGSPDCVPVPVQSDTPFLGTTTIPSLDTMGSISVDATGSAQTLAGRTFQVDMVTQNFTLMARNGLVLLVSDFAQFNDEVCGMATKEALWENLYELYCDRDDDGFLANACGGFDCDDLDDAVGATFTYEDLDGDGVGSSTPSCELDAVTATGDCDDMDPAINPEAVEVCDGIDNDCNNRTDGEDPNAEGLDRYWQDSDEDGHGRANTTPLSTCEEPVEGSWVQNDTDCDDGDPDVNPDVMDLCGNNLDDNCDGQIDETCVTPPPFNTPVPTDDPPGCGCQSSPSGALPLGILGLAALAFRRRS